MRRQKAILIIFSYLFFISCAKVTPGGFWTNYRKDLIVENLSDQGPYGGHREIFWRSNKKNTFSVRNLVEFAAKNKWRLADSIQMTVETLRKWTNNGQTFPFTFSNFTDTSIIKTAFPNWINSDLRLYRF
jgi:hypothetical protein